MHKLHISRFTHSAEFRTLLTPICEKVRGSRCPSGFSMSGHGLPKCSKILPTDKWQMTRKCTSELVVPGGPMEVRSGAQECPSHIKGKHVGTVPRTCFYRYLSFIDRKEKTTEQSSSSSYLHPRRTQNIPNTHPYNIGRYFNITLNRCTGFQTILCWQTTFRI